MGVYGASLFLREASFLRKKVIKWRVCILVSLVLFLIVKNLVCVAAGAMSSTVKNAKKANSIGMLECRIMFVQKQGKKLRR